MKSGAGAPPSDAHPAPRHWDSEPPPNGETATEWLSLAQTKRALGFASQAVVRTWVDYGWLRSRRSDGKLEILRADVLRANEARRDLTAIGGEELTPEELDELAEWQGRLPWERLGADPSR